MVFAFVVVLLLLLSKVLGTTYQNANNKQEIPAVHSASHLTVHISVSTSIFITILRLSFSFPANDGPAKVRQTVRFIDAWLPPVSLGARAVELLSLLWLSLLWTYKLMWLPGSLHSSFHTSSLSHADCSCHILSAAAETTPSSSCFPSPTFPPPTAALFCAIISTAWLTGLLCLLLPSFHSPLAKLIDLPLCRPKVKRNLIRRGRSSSGNSCTGYKMKMPAKWRRKTWQRLCAIFQCVPWTESLCSVPCSTGQQRHGNSGESQ